MSEVAVRESVTVGARPEEVRVARALIGRLLGPSCQCADVAILLGNG
jgi:hypothetical protein